MDKSTVEFTPGGVVKAVEDGFRDSFKPFHKYQTQQHELWSRCIGTISDHSRLDKIVFANNVLKIPPARVFLAFNPDLPAEGLSLPLDKMFLGSFWSYIFMTVFSYRSKRQVSTGLKTLKTALYFYDNADSIVILSDSPTQVPSPDKENGTESTSKIKQEKKARNEA